MSRKTVTRAMLHVHAFIGGTDLGVSLPPSNKTVDLKMSYDSDGLLVFFRGAWNLFPPGSVQLVTFAEDPTGPKTSG